MDITWKTKGSRIESDYEMRYVAFIFHWLAHYFIPLPTDRFHFMVSYSP